VKDTKADVFLILDCCHAASAVESLLEDQNNIAELLVASSIEGKAPLRDQHSLTHKLVQILGIPDFYLKAFETRFLYTRLVNYQKQRTIFLGDFEDCPGETPLSFPIVSRREGNRSILFYRILEAEDDQSSDTDSATATVAPTALLATPHGAGKRLVVENEVLEARFWLQLLQVPLHRWKTVIIHRAQRAIIHQKDQQIKHRPRTKPGVESFRTSLLSPPEVTL
jgi:hypothetical protein